MSKILKKAAPFISVLFFGFALWVLRQELGQYSLHEILRRISQISVFHMVLSLILSGLSYLLLTGYDALGVEYVDEELSYDKIGKAGFIGYAFSHNIGMALISGGSIRYRLYSAWGLSGVQVTKIVGFSAFTLWIGFCSMGGLSLLLYKPRLPQGFISTIPMDLLGFILLSMVAVYLAASLLVQRPLNLWRWQISVPGINMAVKQIIIASLDWLLAASVMYVLLPWAEISFFGFVGVFLLAQIIGLFSQVPGGLGVFESIMILYLSNFINASDVVGVLLVYRLVYYLIPLVLAMGLLGFQEYRANRQVVRDFGSRTAYWLHRIIPTAFSVSIFVGGAVLLFSGSMPSKVPLMRWLQPLIPLPVIEMSHFLASIVGAALLVLAHGLQRRIDAAYHATVGVLIFGIIFSLLRGVSYIQASILAVMLIALIPSRKAFNREAALFSESFSPVWTTMILMVIIGSIGLGLFVYQRIEIRKQLWWQFTLLGDAPRYLRASVGVLGAAFLFGLYKLFRPGSAKRETADYAEAMNIMQQSKSMKSNLLLLGDKKILLSEGENACIMYGVEDRSWISMGDPMGAEDEIEELAWNFKETSEDHDGWPVFYEVGDEHADLYQDLGLTLIKLGEEARVSLPSFEINGKLAGDLIEAHSRLSGRGYTFDILPAAQIDDHLPGLKAVSDAWLQAPGHREKRFSLGYFEEGYLRHFPLATICRADNIVAFCNLCSGAGRMEIGPDLLRYRPEAPQETVDFLLMNAMKWSKEQNYRWFNLGLAPLSKTNEKNLAPKWKRFADQLYGYSRQLYNFEGIRAHKDRFNPRWKPIYLAAPAGLALATVLNNLSALISGRGPE